MSVMKSRIVQLQNDKEALTYLRASHHCLKKEKGLKYLMIILSFGICLAAIFNRYLPQMMPSVKNISDIQEIVATIINLVSGVILVVGLVLGFYVTRMHTEGTVLRDKYEAFVFNNQNPSILRPIPKTVIEMYAKKTHRKPDKFFKNYLYSENDNPKDSTAQFEYIAREVQSDYKLYLSIQPFFLTIWIGFCVLVFLIALSFNDTFITTLINILIPSLSAITIIGNSWYGCRLQMKQLQNLINVVDQIKNMPESKKALYIADERNMRMLADGLFNYRASSFVIPSFLERRFQKKANLESKVIEPSDEKEIKIKSTKTASKSQGSKKVKTNKSQPLSKTKKSEVKVTEKPKATEKKPKK